MGLVNSVVNEIADVVDTLLMSILWTAEELGEKERNPASPPLYATCRVWLPPDNPFARENVAEPLLEVAVAAWLPSTCKATVPTGVWEAALTVAVTVIGCL